MTATLTFDSVADYLGDPEARFFGSGYRRASYQFVAPTLAPGGVSTTVGIGYPSDWSRKKHGHELRPHLSTVDVMVLAARMAGVVLAEHLGLGPELRSRSWIKRVVVRAGAEPQEELEDLPVSASLLRDEPESAGWATASIDCRAGQMRVRLLVVHPVASPPAPRPEEAHLLDLFGESRMRYWGSGFREERQRLVDVVADLDRLTCVARLEITGGGRERRGGVEDALGFRVSVVDAFVSNVQLAQVLLYEMDGVPRSESNTLWMQQTTLERDLDSAAPADPMTIEVEVTDSHLLHVAGDRWRDITFVGRVGDLVQRSTFAHRLPGARTP